MIYVTFTNDLKSIGILNTFLKLEVVQNACNLTLHNLSTNMHFSIQKVHGDKYHKF